MVGVGVLEQGDIFVFADTLDIFCCCPGVCGAVKGDAVMGGVFKGHFKGCEQDAGGAYVMRFAVGEAGGGADAFADEHYPIVL